MLIFFFDLIFTGKTKRTAAIFVAEKTNLLNNMPIMPRSML